MPSYKRLIYVRQSIGTRPVKSIEIVELQSCFFNSVLREFETTKLRVNYANRKMNSTDQIEPVHAKPLISVYIHSCIIGLSVEALEGGVCNAYVAE